VPPPCLPDAVAAVLWLLTQAFLCVLAWRWPWGCPRPPAFRERLLYGLLLFWACLVVVATLLGLCGALTGYGLLAGVSIGCGVIFWTLRSRKGAAGPPPKAAALPVRVLDPWGVVWCAMGAFWVGRILVDGLLVFPSAFDALMYHIPLVDHWLQARSLYAPDSLTWSLPGNNELVGLWCVAPFSGDFLIALVNLPATVLLAAASVEVARNLGLSRGFAHAAGLAVVAQLVVWAQLTNEGNDVAVAALFLATFACGVRFARRGSGTDLVLGGLGLGLLAGVKFYALGYAAAAWAVTVGLVMATRGWRDGLRLAATGIAGGLLCGGYWYVRNTLVTGSPLFPMGTRPDNDVLAEVYPGNLWQTTLAGNGSSELWTLTWEAVWRWLGPSSFAACWMLPMVLGWFAASGWWCRRNGKRTTGALRWAFAALAAASLLVLAVTPVAVEDVPGTLNQIRWGYAPMRYGLCFTSTAVLGAMTVLHHTLRAVGRSVSSIVGTLFAAGAIAQALAWPYLRSSLPADSIDTGLCTINLLLVAGILRLLGLLELPGTIRVAAFVGILAGAAWSGDLLAERWHGGFVPHYGRFAFLNALQEQEAAVAESVRPCILHHQAYPFFGSRRQFRVCQPTHLPSYPWLEESLRRQEATVVVVEGIGDPASASTNRYRWGYRWALEHPDVFVLLDRRAGQALFRVRLPAPAEGNGPRRER
jgi:hypothetical protein